MDSKRLNALLNELTLDDVVADIGSDHGYIALCLAKKGHPYVYASENKKGPYLRLKENIINSGVECSVEVAFADGISKLPPTINTLVIAGMGGALINKILTADTSKLINIKKMVLGPQGGESLVRKEVVDLGYSITNEVIIAEDQKYYEIIVARKEMTSIPLTPLEIEFGPINLLRNDHTFQEMLKEEVARNTKLLNKNLNKARRETIQSRQTKLLRVLEKEK